MNAHRRNLQRLGELQVDREEVKGASREKTLKSINSLPFGNFSLPFGNFSRFLFPKFL
jgi:hypothetical protein